MLEQSLSLIVICLLALSSMTGCNSARDFISERTHLQLTSDVSVCSQAVKDFTSCRPGFTGGAGWTPNKNFDVYNISRAAAEKGYQAELDELRLRYLGTPFYHGSPHTECRSALRLEDLPTEQPLSDDIDLTSILETKTVDEVSANAIFKLKAKGVDLSAKAQEDFKAALQKTVKEKAHVRYIWFLMKWTGGRDSIAKNAALKRCVDEVDAQNQSHLGSASLITGVAGLLVLDNRIDTSVTSDSTITSALNLAISGSYPSQVADLQAQLSVDWKHAVSKVFTVNGSLVALSQTAYPLWVQFE
jgi:hypothetical protein